MACYKGSVGGRGWMCGKGWGGWVGGGGVGGGGGGWAARGRLNPSLGLFGLAMSPRSASHRPKHAYRVPKRCLTITGVSFRPMPFM